MRVCARRSSWERKTTLQAAVLHARVGGEDVERDRAHGAAGLHPHDASARLVAREVLEGHGAVDEALAGAQEVLDLAAGVLVGLQALGEEPLRRGLLGVRRRRGGEGETGGGQGESGRRGASRLAAGRPAPTCARGPTSSVAGEGPLRTLSA